MNLLFKETLFANFVLTRGELLCPLIRWDPVIHYHPLGIAFVWNTTYFFESRLGTRKMLLAA
jgi:hypothetical protein